MDRKLNDFDLLKISVYWLSSNFLWGALLGPVLAEQMKVLAPRHSAEVLGQLYFTGAIPALVVPLLIGPISDRYVSRWGRRRPFVLYGGLLALVGLAVMWQASIQNSLIPFFAGNLVLQVGANTALAAYSGLIPDLVPFELRGRASGYMAVFSQLGMLLGAVTCGFTIGNRDVNGTYGILFGTYALGLALGVFWLKENPKAVEPRPLNWKVMLRSLLVDPRRYPDFGWVWLTRALMMFGFSLIQPFLLFYLRDIIQVDNPARDVSVLLGIVLIGSTVSGYVAGALSDRTGRKNLVYLSSMSIAAMSIGFIFCRSPEQAFIVGMLFGLGYGAYISVDWALVSDVLPDRKDAAKDMAIWHVAQTLPQQTAPLFGGYLLQAFAIAGTKPVQYSLTGYGVLFSLAAVSFFFGAVWIYRVKGSR